MGEGGSRTTTNACSSFSGAGMTDLNSLVDLPDGVILTRALDINNKGQVVAIAMASSIPEPEGYAMFLAGLGMMAFYGASQKASTNFISSSILTIQFPASACFVFW